MNVTNSKQEEILKGKDLVVNERLILKSALKKQSVWNEFDWLRTSTMSDTCNMVMKLRVQKSGK
jgi:hypothetical protein